MEYCRDTECQNINAGIDKCIQPLIKALNDAGIETIASCCGHRKTIGNIALKNGKELIIAPDYETARTIENYFPDIHGNQPTILTERYALAQALKSLLGSGHSELSIKSAQKVLDNLEDT